MKDLKDINYDKPPTGKTNNAIVRVERIYREYEQRKIMRKRTIKELLK